MDDRDNKKLLKAKKMSANGQYDEAFAIMKRLHNKYPGDRLIKFELGKLNVLLGDFEKGVKSLKKLSLTERGPYATVELGRIARTEGNFTKAREYFMDALNNRKKSAAMMELARLEIELGNIENAMSYLSQLTDQKFLVSKMLLLIKIFIIGEDYLKALEYIDKIPIKDDNYENVLKQSHFYIKNKMGLISNIDETTGYLCEQIFSYSESKAIYHIRNHLFKRDNKAIHSIFKSDIDINDLFKKAKEEKENYQISFDGYSDYYIMDVGYNIGTWKNSETTKVKVVIIHNTDNIITIYPYINEYNVRKVNNKRNKLTLK